MKEQFTKQAKEFSGMAEKCIVMANEIFTKHEKGEDDKINHDTVRSMAVIVTAATKAASTSINQYRIGADKIYR